jgi:RhtB (resistance to homoserine/threonine) family protein
MGIHLLAFIGVAVLLAIMPGPDTLIVTKNALLHGRSVALATIAGVSLGLIVWTAAAALGIAAVVRESAVAFTVLKIAGAVYLAWLGLGAIRAARHPIALDRVEADGSGRRVGIRQGFRQGLLTNLGNPKIAIFFTSLLPQFVSGHRPGPAPFIVLGAVFSLIGLGWLSGYALLAARLSRLLSNPRVKAAVDRVSGVVLIGVGVRLALEQR